MINGLTFGNKIITLNEVDSTNSYLQQLISESSCIEGLVVRAKSQTKGRGQRGNDWDSEPDKNLTFSLVLKPNIVVNEQFMISKVVALGLFDYLSSLKIENVKIKWPNDILVEGNKIAGVLIENTLKQNKIGTAIIGVGLNVNQDNFSAEINATSLIKLIGKEVDITDVLQGLLVCMERRYMMLKALNYNQINSDYLANLLGYQSELTYQIEGEIVKGKVVGISAIGKLQLQVNERVNEYGMQEIKLVNE